MGNTLQGQTVLLFSQQKDIAPYPVVQLGIGSDGLPYPVAVSTAGVVSTTGGVNASTTAATLAQNYKTVAASGTPEALGSGLVESVTLTAQKNRTTANTGNVWIGFLATNDTQLCLLVPGDSITYTAPDGKKIDLAGIWIDVATNGDGVLYETGN